MPAPTPRNDLVALVALEPDAGRDVAHRVVRALRIPDTASRACRWYDARRLSILVGDLVDPDAVARATREPGVERLMLVRRHLTERDPERPSESTVVLRHGVAIGGGGRLAVMAGPCSIESASQIDEMADAVRAAGGDILRGGAFKPRTSPFGFAGVGEQGLEWLARAGARTNLPVVSEAIDVDTLDAVAEHSDIIQIGARNMHNFPLLFRAGSHPSGRPILLKRGFGATIEELLLAADYVLVGRRFADIEPRLLLCERGIRTFEPSTRFTFDVAALPVLRLRTHLPVIADPSHAAGDRRLVPALALGAAAAGASGLLLEAHTAPGRAWSDGDQSLDLDALHDVIRRLRAIDAIRGEAQPPHASPRRLEPARSV